MPGKKKEVRCPIEECDYRFPKKSKRAKADLQHHLYMKHKMQLFESHETAERACAS